ARQIQLRNLSGIIIIDFIDMSLIEHKEELLTRLEKELSKDSIKTVLVEMTKLGLVEITRKKIYKPLYEVLKYGKIN
ncbi:MAG: ribonuclease E/G, partial [Clostridium sp.]